jgi:flagellar biosynthesis component FlhA
MKQQAQRATLLTILAAIYLPLTLVTGIFGLVVIGGATAMGFFGYRYWRRGHQARESADRERENKMYKLA